MQDIRLLKHSGYTFWYGLLLVFFLIAPLWFNEFYLGEITTICIYSVISLGLMVLVGFTGQVSLGHGAFLAIGAYSNAYLISQGVPFLIAFPLSGVITALVGICIGIPALKITGVYLAIATLAFGIITEEIAVHWKSVTGGFQGFPVDAPSLFGYELWQTYEFYYLCFFVLILCILLVLNLLRTPTGRAFIAIRNSETSAQSMGIHLSKYKVISFAISAGITGLGGALFGHRLGYLSPDAFNFLMSIQLLIMVIVGGLGSIHGAIFGAIFIGVLPQFLAIARDYIPVAAEIPGLEAGTFGIILILFILFEPLGIYGRWRKIKLYFELFPLYRKATFKRQKTYLKTERMI